MFACTLQEKIAQITCSGITSRIIYTRFVLYPVTSQWLYNNRLKTVTHTDWLVMQGLKRKFLTKTEKLDKRAICKSANKIILILTTWKNNFSLLIKQILHSTFSPTHNRHRMLPALNQNEFTLFTKQRYPQFPTIRIASVSNTKDLYCRQNMSPLNVDKVLNYHQLQGQNTK